MCFSKPKVQQPKLPPPPPPPPEATNINELLVGEARKRRKQRQPRGLDALRLTSVSVPASGSGVNVP